LKPERECEAGAWWVNGRLRLNDESRDEKQKGITLLRCPLASANLAPPAFTAPCRNQVSDFDHRKGNERTSRFFEGML
jgi:hypothetical protein